MSLIVGDIKAHHSRWVTKTKEANNYLTKSMQPATPFLARMKLRGYRQMAGQLRPTSVWPPMTSHYYQTGLSLPHWPAIICPWWWWCRPHPVREHAQDLRPPLGARPASPPTRQAAQPPPRGPSTNPRPLV